MAGEVFSAAGLRGVHVCTGQDCVRTFVLSWMPLEYVVIVMIVYCCFDGHLNSLSLSLSLSLCLSLSLSLPFLSVTI